MFNSFKKNKNNQLYKDKENLEDFILILKQIQEANNQKTLGKGSFFKNYKEKQTLIDNITTLSIEAINKKIMELG